MGRQELQRRRRNGPAMSRPAGREERSDGVAGRWSNGVMECWGIRFGARFQ
jgi:hypothetical protein